MQTHMQGNHVLAQAARIGPWKPHLLRQLFAQNGAADSLHNVEGASHDALILCIGQGLWAVRENRVEGFENPVFPAHVMGALGFSAERRTAQHHLPVAYADQIGEVGEAAWKLQNFQFPGKPGNGLLQKILHRFLIEFFAAADIGGLVNRAHQQLLRGLGMTMDSTTEMTKSAYSSTDMDRRLYFQRFRYQSCIMALITVAVSTGFSTEKTAFSSPSCRISL